MHGEKVAKESPRTTAGELQKIVESRGQKTLEKLLNITTCCSAVFPEILSISSKNNLQHIQLSDTTVT